MPHIDVVLTDSQARFLGKRARAARTTSKAVLQALIGRALQDAIADGSQEGALSARAAFGGFAEPYSTVVERLSQSDPELRLGASSEPAAAEDAQPSSETRTDDALDPSDPIDPTTEDLRQAFAEFELAYRDISDQVFGDDAAFSAHLPDRHIEGIASSLAERQR